MPIDYSKFDNIDDSDEEKIPQGISTNVATQGSRSSGGREKLEPKGLDERLQILPTTASLGSTNPNHSSPFAGMEGALESWAAPRGTGNQGMEPEPSKPGEPQRLCMKSDGRKKIHTTYPDGTEAVEEFDERTDVLLVRKTRRPGKFGGEGEWVYEVGQAPETAFDPHTDLLRSSSSNPIFLRKDTPEQFQWRIRNLTYPADVYSVTVDHEKQEIIVRTSNKKYFKRFGVPDLARAGLTFKDNLLTWKHQHNTLIISYVKPAEVLEQEQKALREVDKQAIKM